MLTPRSLLLENNKAWCLTASTQKHDYVIILDMPRGIFEALFRFVGYLVVGL
jgi:hypothetical protein